MNTTKLSVAAIIVAAAGAAMAADVPSTGKTRAQVQAELADARANGEYDALTMSYIDPFPVDGRSIRVAQASTTPATQAPAVQVQRTAAPAPGPKTRAEVKEELARAKASGEYDAMVMFYEDPAPVERSRAMKSR
jgi:Domain of unknown function (DUF4148)